MCACWNPAAAPAPLPRCCAAQPARKPIPPGDRLGRPTEFSPAEPSNQPGKLPIINDPGGTLTEVIGGRDALPLVINTLAKAAAAGARVADAEVDPRRAHLNAARYQLLAQYPDIDATVLLNCLLLAATAGIATGDEISANYHLTWFQVLSSGECCSDGRR